MTSSHPRTRPEKRKLTRLSESCDSNDILDNMSSDGEEFERQSLQLKKRLKEDATPFDLDRPLAEDTGASVKKQELSLATRVSSEPETNLTLFTSLSDALEKSEVKKEARASMAQLLNPKAEIKKEMLLDDRDVLSRLDNGGLVPFPISLEENIRDAMISRRFLSQRYGGNEQDTFPHPAPDKLAKHGYNNFMCINLLYNPNGPQRPGHPGLFYETQPASGLWRNRGGGGPATQIVFVRIQSNQWLYLGEYELTAAPSLTMERWLAQDNVVRRKWSEEIQTKGWGRTVRARVHLRILNGGQEPTKEEFAAALESSDAFKHITSVQIMSDYDNGNEVIGVWTMKCTHYDEDFQRDLYTAFKKFYYKPVKSRKKK